MFLSRMANLMGCIVLLWVWQKPLRLLKSKTSVIPMFRSLKKLSWKKGSHIHSSLATIAILLLHSCWKLVYCTAMRYHFNLKERKQRRQCGLWCFLLASIVSWELIKMRLLCSNSLNSRTLSPPHTHAHTTFYFFYWLNKGGLRARRKLFSVCECWSQKSNMDTLALVSLEDFAEPSSTVI